MAKQSAIPSIAKLRRDLANYKLLTLLVKPSQRKNVKELEQKLNHMIEQIELFNDRFTDYGWCAYDSINLTLLESANSAYESDGIDAAERVLIEYYRTDVSKIIHGLQVKSRELAARYGLIEKAFNDHLAERYHSSIPVFLIVIDGAVNDFTKSRGFFAEGTDVSAWDCFVGAEDGLLKLKDIFTRKRNRTNAERITLPYRNGILHGRDLNYDNEYVSCKCIALLFAIGDWMSLKKSESERKTKLYKEMNPPSLTETLAKIRKSHEERNEISNWKKRNVEIGANIPNMGKAEEYTDYPYILPVLQMKLAWEKHNYGELSVVLKNLFHADFTDNKRAGECRKLFGEKELQSFELVEVEERGCSMSKIVIGARWMVHDKEFEETLTFGCLYKSNEDEKDLALPWKGNGYWELMPWDIGGLYKV